MTAPGSSADAAPGPEPDPLLALLVSLGREGKLVAGCESAHQSFLRYQEDAVRIAASADIDRRGVDTLCEIFDATTATDAMAVLLQELLALQNIVIEHLTFEESVTVPVIGSWTEWPIEDCAQ